MPKVRAHHRSLPYQDVPEALEMIAASGASESAKLCFRFVVLTASRSGEARAATWDEIDAESALWTVPVHRMKAGRAHRVPLSDAAMGVLEETDAIRDESGLVFPSPRKFGRPLSDLALTKLLRDNGLSERTTVHGFRSSFRNRAQEQTGASHAAMELALAHAVGSAVEQAYMRSDLLEQRRPLMQQWADYLQCHIVQTTFNPHLTRKKPVEYISVMETPVERPSAFSVAPSDLAIVAWLLKILMRFTLAVSLAMLAIELPSVTDALYLDGLLSTISSAFIPSLTFFTMSMCTSALYIGAIVFEPVILPAWRQSFRIKIVVRTLLLRNLWTLAPSRTGT